MAQKTPIKWLLMTPRAARPRSWLAKTRRWDGGVTVGNGRKKFVVVVETRLRHEQAETRFQHDKKKHQKTSPGRFARSVAVPLGARSARETFFASFFQKRSASLPLPPLA
jgi:hypothetical protein